MRIRTDDGDAASVDRGSHTDLVDDRRGYQFQMEWLGKKALPARCGARPDLTPHARGNLVANTVCERVFQDCSRTQVSMTLAKYFVIAN